MLTNAFLLMNNLIYQIYNTSDFDMMKRNLLNLLKILIPNSCSSILMANHTDGEQVLCNPVCLPESFVENEKAYIDLEIEDTTRWLILCNQATVIRESDLVSEKDLINSNIYKKCYAPRNLFYSM